MFGAEASPRVQRVRKVSAGLRRVSSLLSKGSSGRASRSAVQEPRRGWSDDLDPVLAAARWAADAAAHTPRTARELMQQCPVDPRQLVSQQPAGWISLPRTAAVESAPPTSADILRCHRSRTPSPVAAEAERSAPPTEVAGCTCEFSDRELRCVHVFEVSDGSCSDAAEQSEFGGSSHSRGCLTLPTTPLMYAQVREHLAAQLGADLPREYIFMRGGIPVGKKQELKWPVGDNTLVIKAKPATGESADSAQIEPAIAHTTNRAPVWDQTIETPERESPPWNETVASQDEELRYDEEDGEAYPLTSFIDVYGHEDGTAAWRTARVARPAPSTKPQPLFTFSSTAPACGLTHETQLTWPATAATPAAGASESARAAVSAVGVRSGLSVEEALRLIPWSVAYGRVMSI